MTQIRNVLTAIEVEDRFLKRSEYARREQQVAIADLLAENTFEVIGRDGGPYRLVISTIGARLTLRISSAGGVPVATHIMSFRPLARVIREYVMICHSHYDLASSCNPFHIEALDMGRRALHNEGSQLLREKINDKIIVDDDTGRRLFTLICVSAIGLSATL